MKKPAFLFSASLFLLAAPALAQAQAPAKDKTKTAAPTASAMLRLQCDGDSADAEVFIDGKFKGECPFDMKVAEGELAVRAVKPHGDSHERVYARTVRVAADTVRRLEIVLGPPQLTEAGRKLQAERERLAREEAERQAREAAARKREQEAAARRQLDSAVDADLRQRREKTPATIPDCPDCPTPMSSLGGIDTSLPALADAQANDWARQALADMRAYLADPAGFRPPGGFVPPACPGAEAALNELAKLRDGRLTPPNVQYFRDHKWWVAPNACVDGRLDGAVEAWGFAVNVTSLAYKPDFAYATPTLVRLRLTMRAGQASGEFQHARLSEHLDGTGGTLLSAIEFLRGAIEDKGESFVAVTAHDTSKNLSVVHSLALDDGRKRNSHYDGARLSWQYHSRNDKMHGRWISFEEGSQGEKCFRDDEEIKLEPCVVD